MSGCQAPLCLQSAVTGRVVLCRCSLTSDCFFTQEVVPIFSPHVIFLLCRFLSPSSSISIFKNIASALRKTFCELFTAGDSVAFCLYFCSSVYLKFGPPPALFSKCPFSPPAPPLKPHPPPLPTHSLASAPPLTGRAEADHLYLYIYLCPAGICVLLSIWAGWRKDIFLRNVSAFLCFFVYSFLSFKDLAYLSGGMFPIWALLARGKMRSRCWIHMLRLCPRFCTQTHGLEYVQKRVGAKSQGGTNSNLHVCVRK